jgi:hypothetical protein
VVAARPQTLEPDLGNASAGSSVFSSRAMSEKGMACVFSWYVAYREE